MTIAVIGTGQIGGTLGRAFARAGLDVVFGSRRPEVAGEATGDTAAKVAGVAEALAAAEIVVLALPGDTVADFLAEHGPALAGRLVVDSTNNIEQPVLNHAATVAAHAPEARYARAFNTVGWEVFAEPLFDGTPADLLYSAAEADRAAVEELVAAVGLRPVYLGPEQYEVLDAVVRLWFTLAVARGNGRHLAFKVLSD